MAKKYSKNEIKKKGLLKFLIVLFILIFIASVSFIIFVGVKNYIVIENISDEAKNKSDDIVKNSTPIILNNIIVGAVYNNQWVASESYYFRNDKNKTEVDVYTKDGKKGKYNIISQEKDLSSAVLYAYVDTPDTSSEFLAVSSSDKNIMFEPAKQEVDIDEIDIQDAKEALGMLGILNNSLRIASIHDVALNASNRGRIFCITNESGKSSGGYSAVIFISSTGESKIIKYSYVKDLKNSSDWPIYSLKFVADLNGDGMNEIILQEVKEFDVKYDVVEYKNNNFTEVLSTTMKLKQ